MTKLLIPIVLALGVSTPGPLAAQGNLNWSACAPPNERLGVEWPADSFRPRMDSMIRTMSERLKKLRGGVVWPWTADSIDLGPELRADSMALTWALAYLAVDDAMSDANTAFLSAYLYRRISGAPAPLFAALAVSPNGERRAELALALRPPLDPTTESIVAGFVCDASRQLVDLHPQGQNYWDDRPPPPFYWVARFEVMAGWGALSPAMRTRVRPFVEAGLPDEYHQLFGDAER